MREECVDERGNERTSLRDAEGAQTPGWAGPHTLPNIRVDVCEIQ